MYYLRFIIFVLGSFFLFSCKSELTVINPDDYKAQEIPVIQAIANSFDSTIVVSITKVVPFNKQYSLDSISIKNAIVAVTINNTEQLKLPLGKDDYYWGKLLLKPKDSLSLTISINQKIYIAYTKVPPKPENFQFEQLSDNKFYLSWFAEESDKGYFIIKNRYIKETGELSFDRLNNNDYILKTIGETTKIEGKLTNIYKKIDNVYEFYKGKKYSFVIHSLNRDYYNFNFGKNQGLKINNRSAIPTFFPEGNFNNEAIGYFGALSSVTFDVIF